jgi:LacI family transcriptional regulator
VAVTLAQIALKVGVDVSLVSRVLRGDPQARVSDKKRARILAVALASGYRPNRVARSLRTRQTNVLAMLTPDITNPFHSFLFRAVERAAALVGYQVILCNTDDSSERFRQVVETLAEGHVDGLLIATAQREDSAIDWLRQCDLPFVLLNRRSDIADDPWIGPDDHQTGWLGANYLAKLGHRRIAFLGGPPTSNMILREAGFRAALNSLKCPIHEKLVITGIEHKEAAKECVQQMLELPCDKRPTAFFVPHTQMSSAVFTCIYRSGLRLPADISLVGYSALSSPDITSVCAPLDEIGQLGTDFLIRRLRGGNSFSSSKLHIMLPVTLVDTGSAARLDIKKGSSRRLRVRS